ncbi:MAG: hypothetical protein QM820_56765 [Minicystis sp.]
MKIWAWAAAVGSVAALVACGGGGNGNTGGGGAGGNPSSSSSTTVSASSGSPTSSSSGTGGTTGCGSFLYSSDATCQGCAEQNCCAELQACDTGTLCNDLFTCLDGCDASDTTCSDTCIQDNMGGVSDAQALITCVTGPQGGTGACNTECSSGQICDSGLVNQNNPACGDCAGAQCCAEFDACVADTACKDCITGVGTNCDTNTLYKAATDCVHNKCSDVCGAEICDSGLSTSNGKCDTCLGSKCCGVIDTCYGKGTANEGNTACFKNCLSKGTPDASCATDTDYQAVKTCWNTNCAGANDCGGML